VSQVVTSNMAGYAPLVGFQAHTLLLGGTSVGAKALLAEAIDQCRRDPRSRSGFRHHLSEHRTEPHHNCDETERRAHAVLKSFHRRDRGHTGGEAEDKRDRNESDEWVKLEARYEHDERDHRK